jgi:hypothetical protein
MKKWLLETPLAPAWRSRLEMCLGVVLSGAVVVALSSTIRPDPAKVAALRGTPPLVSSPQPPHRMLVEALDGIRLSPTPELTAAAKAGDVGAMRAAFRPGMTLDGLLAAAAHSGRKDAVMWLLAIGADVHDAEHSVASAVIAGDAFPEIVAVLREKGAAEPSLDNAATASARNAVTRILAADPDKARDGTALRRAAASTMGTPADKRFVMEKLLDAGANPNVAYEGDTALGAVVQSCDTPKRECMTFVRLLLDRGARVSGDAVGAALSLDDSRRSEPLEALLERPLEKGVTSAALARATSISAEDLKRIVKLGVDWAWHDGEADEALPVLEAARRGNRDYTRALLDAGAPVDVHFKQGACALAEAIDRSGAGNESDYARIVELLVMRGANVNRRFPDGRTPLFAAAESGNIRVVNFLLARGAHVNDRILDDTALDIADQRSNVAAARVLAAHGGHRARPSY